MTRNSLLKNSIGFCAVLPFLALIGCSKQDTPPPPQPAAKPPASAAPAASAKPVQKQVSSATPKLAQATANQFDFSNKKDPFKPFVVVKQVNAPSRRGGGQQRTDSLPIHSFDVGQFKLIGVVMAGRDSKAMLTDPNGKGYVVKVGMTIGKNEGRIVSIAAGGLDVVEQFRDDNGKVRKETIKITLPRKQ